MPTSGGGKIVWSGDDLPTKIKEMGVKVHGYVSKAMEYHAREGQNYMRTNAPWTDRTANARQGLFARSFSSASDGGEYVMVLYHTMPYGIWLETRWSGRYKIIEPALKETGQNLMSTISDILARI